MKLFDKRVLALEGGRRALGVCLVAAAGDAALAVGQACALAGVLCALWEGASLAAQAPAVALFGLCYMARHGIAFARAGFMEATAQRSVDALVRRLMATVFEQGPALVQRFGSAKVTTAAVEGAERVKSYIELSLPKAADLMVVPAVLAAALLLVDWVSGVIAVAMIPCVVLFMRLLGMGAREAAAAQHEEYDRLTNSFADTLRGFPTIKTFGRSRAFDERVYARSEALRAATVKTLRTVTLSSLVLDVLRVFALAAVAIMLGFRLMDGSITLFSALVALVVVPEYFAAIRRYSADHHAMLEGRNQLAAFAEMLDADADAAGGAFNGAGCSVAGGGAGESAAAPALRVEELSFTHPDGTRALRDVSFSAAAASKVGIVGASGAGKSTLVSLLAGFARPGAGSFALDGHPLESLDVPAWRRQVTYIPQDPHIFSASLRDNIAFYYPDASYADVAAAASAVGLSGLVAELPDGLDTPVGAGARQLSGGQAQRVALARALLDTQRRVWLFDEPTAHLDVETELALKREMLPLMEGRLVFFATHRLHWMRDMDLLVVLDEGRVVQVGGYEELEQAAGGAFSELLGKLREGYAV